MTRELRAGTCRLVEQTTQNEGLSEELRVQTHRCLAAAGVLFLLPFSVNNFYQERLLLGCGSLMIVFLLIFNSFVLRRRCRYSQGISALLVLMMIVFIYLSFGIQGASAVFWCYPSVIVFYFILPERKARVFNLLALAVLMPQAWECLRPDLALRATVTLFLVSLSSAVFINLLGQQQRYLRELAIRDPLTGLFNRLLLETFLDRALLLAERNANEVSLIMVDVDRFKSINDSYGHEAGDRVLRKLGRLLVNRVRRSDVVFRLGGEEFLVLLADTDEEAAFQVANELRALVEDSTLIPDRRVTISVGVATREPGEGWQNWLKRSDLAVYQAKEEGRNRAVRGMPGPVQNPGSCASP